MWKEGELKCVNCMWGPWSLPCPSLGPHVMLNAELRGCVTSSYKAWMGCMCSSMTLLSSQRTIASENAVLRLALQAPSNQGPWIFIYASLPGTVTGRRLLRGKAEPSGAQTVGLRKSIRLEAVREKVKAGFWNFSVRCWHSSSHSVAVFIKKSVESSLHLCLSLTFLYVSHYSVSWVHHRNKNTGVN